MKRNIVLTIEYDGTEFVGWQRQPNGRSVQEEIERTLSSVTQATVSVTGAGRTDSGVHALGQVANFHSDTDLSLQDLHRALNGLLPEDIVVHGLRVEQESFSARFSATSREYAYHINRSPTAVDRHFCWHLRYPFDVDAMDRIARRIIGEHDFQSFCKTESETEHFRCIIYESRWELTDNRLVYHVRANRFLQGMVRALVGTMVNIGRGFTPETEFQTILEGRNRSLAGQSAPAKGLFLERVTY